MEMTAKEHPLSSAMSNLHRAVGQMLLLEEHLTVPTRECQDCILKHFLTLEALGEEGVQLPGGPNVHRTLALVSREAGRWISQYQEGSRGELGQEIRALRKKILAACGSDI